MQENYSYIQKILHHLCLGNTTIKKTLFLFETSLFKNENDIENNQHLFICGLPRSGTTALLIGFYETNIYASLTYKDMPFVLAPNLSNFFLNNTKKKSFQRPHNDKIIYDIKSPEALDEIFFKTFQENEIKKNLNIYISLILKKYKKNLYLSKNNNILDKINLIKSIYRNSCFLVPFRDPLQHAYSLLLQHKNFIKLQKRNNFILDYMNYLGHFEFGINHKSWNNPDICRDFNDINYWLEQWLLYYKKIYTSYTKLDNLYLVSYDSICKDKKKFSQFLTAADLKLDNLEKFKLSYREIDLEYDKFILNECDKVYQNLVSIYNNY
tara:strand:+ start:2148 stop:3119 length:972 start_codon:yes stop_codon:yes gene_type:complete